ncbi:MAG: hypothetical protein QNJ91_06140 [Gammaproteobacteria bacterium]|nr:hypothetical protein [Gammaproteobacteria bacterium]
MPAGPVIAVVSWLASHLILWTLLAFLFVGLVLFGVVDVGLPGSAPHDPASASRPAQGAVPPAAPVAGQMPPAAAVEPTPPQRAPPKMIGGSLPVYDVRGRDDMTRHTPESGAFRPPSAAAPATAAPPGLDELLQRARRAYWDGEFERAEAAYMDAVTQYPGEPDPFGELGNLYEAMGKPALAQDAFFEAAVRLKERGQQEKLNEVIRLLDDKGDARAPLLR